MPNSMHCEGPDWVTIVLDWRNDGIIDNELVNAVMQWLVEESIVVCQVLSGSI